MWARGAAGASSSHKRESNSGSGGDLELEPDDALLAAALEAQLDLVAAPPQCGQRGFELRDPRRDLGHAPDQVRAAALGGSEVVRLVEERRQKMAAARHRRKERNLAFRQPTFAFEAMDLEVRRPPISSPICPT